jgi:hypothetical protein
MQLCRPGTSDPRRRRTTRTRTTTASRPAGPPALTSSGLSAVLRAQAGPGALAVLSPILPSPRRGPSAALVAVAALPPVSRPRAVPPRRRVGLDAPPAAPAIGRRAIPIRGHQTAAPDARHVSTTGHGCSFPTIVFCANQRGRRLSHGWRLGAGWGVTRPGCGHGWSSPSAVARSSSRPASATSPRVVLAGCDPTRG